MARHATDTHVTVLAFSMFRALYVLCLIRSHRATNVLGILHGLRAKI